MQQRFTGRMEENNNIEKYTDERRLKKRQIDVHNSIDGPSSDEEIPIRDKTVEEKEASMDADESDYEDNEGCETQRAKDNSSKPDESKPTQSYIALIAKAILSSPERKMVLSDIYKYILDNYPFYKTQDKSWRNSIRHNLSLNECFIKAGRSENGKGNYWAVHPSNEEDFAKGDYRRRRTRRKARRPVTPFGVYSDYFQPYAILPSLYRYRGDSLSRFWGASEHKLGISENKITKLFPQEKRRKSFTIDSILGLDKEQSSEKFQAKMKERREMQEDPLRGHVSSRRHHSWSRASACYSPRSPSYERSAFSPVYSHLVADPCIQYTLIPDYLRRLDAVPYLTQYTRDSLDELNRFRKSVS